ncbi:MAG TPA: carboxypeptidase regulatory-like domain-containing protein [Pyrinomonadaceae bacterium]|nr:carboxypeptidase regulatory-like domain-containing protein [Pyrinomonadaceae bacterium]
MNIRKFISPILCAAFVVAFSINAVAQNRASLRGSISDEFGATIVGATVTLTDASGVAKTATTNNDGAYSFTNLAPGKYKISAIAAGFAASEAADVDVAANRRDPLNITLKIAAIETQVKVNAENPVSTDPNANANQQVITGKDLDALPDDPDDLAAALQALAGPSMGPNGGQIFIDGFSGANLPPKEAIREIRINQNPFSPENDQPSARIDILTRPGTDKFRGSASVNFTDESLNSRNPFSIRSSKRAPYQQRQFNGSISGPIVKKKASFFLELGHNEMDSNALINATVLDANFNPLFVGQAVVVPSRNTNIGPRFDYAINSKNTLIARYNFFHTTNISGLGGYGLISRSYPTSSTNHNIQLTETAVINATTINEIRFQYSHNRSEQDGNNTIPGLNVSTSFNGGGSQIGAASNTNQRWELNEFMQKQHGMHTFKFGGRIRGTSSNDISPNNFGGSWGFQGGFGPQLDASFNPIAGTNIVLSSLERYRRTVFYQQNGLSAAQQAFCGAGVAANDCIRLLGGGASSFSQSRGNPNGSISQTDIGVYWQDDWRVRPNLTFSYGIRYENQTNANSHFNFAPRLAFAWSPGAANSTKPPHTVVRGGGGVFYERVGEGIFLSEERNNGVNLQSISVPEPFNPGNPPTLAQITASRAIYDLLNTFKCTTGGPTNCVANVPSLAGFNPTQQAIIRVASNMTTPTMYLVGAQVEHQFPKNISGFMGVSEVHRLHAQRIRDINAPIPGTIDALLRPQGIRPDPTLGDVNQYESSATMHMTQMFIGFNSRLNPNLSFNGSYVLGTQKNDSDGGFPANSYDMSGEWGRGGGDIRHRFNFFGTYNNPKLWKLAFNPFVIINSGGPYNIITGTDANLDRVATERPTFAQLNAYCTKAPDRCTHFNYSRTDNTIIPRNYGNGPGSVTVNLRVSRTWSWGGEARSAANRQQQGNQQAGGQGNNSDVANAKRQAGGGSGGRNNTMMGGGMAGAGGGGGGPRGGGGGGPQMMMMGGPGGPGGPAKYNLTLSVNFNNILNHVNYSMPVGNLTAPNFGQFVSTGGSFGGFGQGGGDSGPNRKIYLNARFTF